MKRYRIAFRLALFTALVTYGLILLGGVVHNTGSSLACPDWPLCYGELFPQMKGGVLYEHSHRLLGTLVGLCTIGLCVALWRTRPGFAPLRRVGLGLLALVILQGVLGGITVIYKLPTIVSTAHLATSMIVLLTLLFLCRATWVRAQPEGFAPPQATSPNQARTAFSLLAATVGVIYIQLVLGALVRHTGSSEAAGWGLAHAIIGMDPATGQYSFWPRNPQAQLNMLHRYIALLAAMMVLLCCARCYLLLGERFTRGRGLAVWLPVGLVLLQILAGVAMLAAWNLRIYPGLHVSDRAADLIQITLRTSHLAIGGLLLASLFYLAVLVREAKGQPAPAGQAWDKAPSLQPS